MFVIWMCIFSLVQSLACFIFAVNFGMVSSDETCMDSISEKNWLGLYNRTGLKQCYGSRNMVNGKNFSILFILKKQRINLIFLSDDRSIPQTVSIL